MSTSALEMREITKEFPGVRALDGVSFDVRPREIHALVGENGAGKSTLVKILAGIHPAGTYGGHLRVNGAPAAFRSVRDSEASGIAIICQELSLVQPMTVAENLFLGHERAWFGIIHRETTWQQARQALAQVHLQINPSAAISELGVGQQQLVEIAKALAKRCRILVLDEPTAALTERETDALLDMLRDLRNQGFACVYISHRLKEVFALADRITVLRDGAAVGTWPTHQLDERTLVAHMVGRALTQLFPARRRTPGAVALEVHQWTVINPDDGRTLCDHVSFQARFGEVLGIAGLMGAGRTVLSMSLFGAAGKVTGGVCRLLGHPACFTAPHLAIEGGLSYVSEDRKRYGLVLSMNVRENITLATLETDAVAGVISHEREHRRALEMVAALHVKTPSLEHGVNTLSGGNQQKVVLAKWLLTQPKVLVLDEPTRGIDVRAKQEIYEIIEQLARHGTAVIMISSELPEVLGMSDRVLVLREGRVAGELPIAEATQEAVMRLSTGAA